VGEKDRITLNVEEILHSPTNQNQVVEWNDYTVNYNRYILH